MQKNKIVDLFCGAGGLSLGFEQAGFKSVLAIDKWNDAIITYNFNRNDKVGTTVDIHDFSNEQLKKINKNKDIVGIVGGPPCQGFSLVGTRATNDPRNSLYIEYYRFVSILEPDFFVLENVPGLLSMENGRYKDDIIKRFTELGYNVDFQVLRASDYGVPQSRKRVFFIGLLQSKYNHSFFDFNTLRKTKQVGTKEAIDDLPPLIKDHETNKYSKKPTNEFQKEMRGKCNILSNHQATIHTQKTIDVISKVPDGGSIRDLPKEYYKIRNYNAAFKRMNSKLPSGTIDCGHRNYFHYSFNRIPTVRESARIQSFPDAYVFCGSKTSQYTQVGNAVPVKLAKEIATQIYKIIGGKNHE